MILKVTTVDGILSRNISAYKTQAEFDWFRFENADRRSLQVSIFGRIARLFIKKKIWRPSLGRLDWQQALIRRSKATDECDFDRLRATANESKI